MRVRLPPGPLNERAQSQVRHPATVEFMVLTGRDELRVRLPVGPLNDGGQPDTVGRATVLTSPSPSALAPMAKRRSCLASNEGVPGSNPGRGASTGRCSQWSWPLKNDQEGGIRLLGGSEDPSFSCQTRVFAF